MNDKEIIDILNSKGVCNLVAIAVSPWHAHGIDSAIMRLRDSGIRLKGVIFAIKHPNSERCINKSNFVSPDEDIDVIECDFASKSMVVKAMGNISAWFVLSRRKQFIIEELFYVIRPSYPDFNWINIINKYNSRCNTVFISVDEGTSSYLVNDKNSNWINYISSLDENKPTSVQTIKRGILRILAKPRKAIRESISCILKNRNLFYVWNLLNNEDGNALSINEGIAPYYKKTLLKLPLNGVTQSELMKYEDSIVISSSPPENGFIDPNADLNTFMILSECLKKHNERIVFKLHPRESNSERYSVLEFSISQLPNVSQEAIVSKLRILPKCIIGIDSTTLVTLKSIYNIPAISLANIFLESIADQPTRMMIMNYIETFSGIIMMPRNPEELNDCITKILDYTNK